MLHLLNSELFRLRKRSQSWVLFAIATALTALIYGGYAIAARVASGPDAASMRQDATFLQFAEFGITMSVGFFVSIMVIIVAAGMMGNEYSWNTLRPLVARSASRSGLLSAKILALAVYTLLFTLGLTLVTAGMFFIGSWIVGEPSGFTFSILWDGIVYALRLIGTNVPYIALAFFLATVFRSNAAGIAGSLGIMFIEQPIFMLLTFANDVFSKVEKWGIFYNVSELTPFNLTGDTVRSTVILIVYSVLFIAGAFVVFQRRDVTSG